MPTYNDYYALNLGELETEVLRKSWINANEDGDGFAPDASFIKYTRYRVDKKINQAYMELVFSSRALRSWFILPLKNGFTQYPVPAGVFDIETVYLFQSASSYCKLEVEEISYIEDQLSPGWMTTPGIPEYAYVGERVGMRIKLGVAPASTQDATAITVGTGGVSTTRPYGGVDGVFGAAGAASSGVNYVDSSGQDFVALGVVVGLKVYNITTNTTGIISSITTTTNDNDTLVSTVTWTAGDTMRILSGEIGSTISIGDDEATYILSPTSGNYPFPLITMAANNLLVRGWTLPVMLVSKYQYPELSPYFHQAIATGAAMMLGKEEPPDSLEFKQALVYEEAYLRAKAELSGFVGDQYKTAPRMISRGSR